MNTIMSAFANKRIILFGSGSMSARVIEFLQQRNLPIPYIVDNDPAKWKSTHYQIDIHSPMQLLQEDKEQLLIVIACSYYTEIHAQLTQMEFKEHLHFIDGSIVINYLLGLEASVKRQEVVDFPFGIFNIELTNRCPMKCIMCARTHGMTRDQGDMEFEVFRSIIDEVSAKNPDYCRKHDLWLHHFGESLLHPEFDAFIRYAAEHGMRPALSINPIMLNEETSRRLLLAQPYKLYISLDGHDNESFYRIRGVKQAYEPSKDNLLRFLRMKKELNASVIVVLSMINFATNESSIRQMKAVWEETEGIDEFIAKDFVSWNGDIEEINRYEAPRRYDQRDFAACNIPWETVTITWDGDIVPCCYDYDKKFVLGNVKEESIEAIWNSEAMRSLRREFMMNQVTNPLCRSCTSLYDIGTVARAT